MRRDHEGYVLLIVLIYLQLFALLGLELVANLLVSRSQLRLDLQRMNDQDNTLQILQFIDHEDVARCRSLNYSVNTLMRESSTWWKQHACHGYAYGQDYYYFREILAIYPDTYYRLSLRMGTMIVQDTLTQKGERLMLRWLR
jgi:hypothetical protein